MTRLQKILFWFISVALIGVISWGNYKLGVESIERIELIHIVNDSTVSVVTDKYAYDYMSVKEFQDYFDITLKLK